MKDTRERLIEATFQEVYSKGYHAASLSHILATADVKKGAMYHHFKSKKEMVLAMIEEKVEKRIESFWQALRTQEEDIFQLIITILQDTTNRDFKRGCPLGNLLQETLNDDEEFSQLLTKILTNWQALLEESLKKAIKNNEIKPLNIQETALFIIASLEGAVLIAKNSTTSKEFDICMKQLENYLNMYLVESNTH